MNSSFARLVFGLRSVFLKHDAMLSANRLKPTAKIEGICELLRCAVEEGDFAKAKLIEDNLTEVERARPVIKLLRGRLAMARGEFEAASGHLRDAVTGQVDFPEAYYWSATLCMRGGREAEGLNHALMVERLRPGIPEMRSLIGVVRYREGNISAAIAAFEATLDVDQRNEIALRGLATIYYEAQEWSKAAHHFQCLLTLQPNSWWALSGLACNFAALGREADAWPLFERAVALCGDSIDPFRNYATALFNAGETIKAFEQCEAGLRRDPEQPLLHVGRANCKLILQGNISEGWSEYEWRKKLEPTFFRTRTRLWTGSAGIERLLVYAEQGMGDVLMFARYIPKIRTATKELVVKVPRTLSRLMRSSDTHFRWNVTKWIDGDDCSGGEAQFDYELPLLSAIHTCSWPIERTTAPYLAVDDELVRKWDGRLGPCPVGRLRVGLVWAGNPSRHEDYLRSILPDALAPLASVRNVDFVSLQMTSKPVYRNSPLPIPVVDFTNEVADFADTAAIMRNLDLVLSIDTAAAHLAGGIGIPCWVLLSRIPDWRWEMGGVPQPWYGNHQSFVVERNGEWTSLIQRVATELNVRAKTILESRRQII